MQVLRERIESSSRKSTKWTPALRRIIRSKRVVVCTWRRGRRRGCKRVAAIFSVGKWILVGSKWIVVVCWGAGFLDT